ncbi:hypothetical protein BOTBODRAFT_177536 [Botryobasidium botryosum FD-172 SS1]|uniref:Uncharacterized protein n=1 Tax=Botryobasidium botryosum (strain FD-172 SS1) TaxID=930990 RepID=A0A067M8L5_BOTB1|nr:hypothetical protein BOTBODRAFT_177536 [Botryobasidium botryosum FD-172 SS1]
MLSRVWSSSSSSPHGTPPQLNTCIGNINGAWATFLPAMFFHAVIFGILLWKTLATPRSAKTPLLRVLLRDGFIYFFVIFLAMFANLMIWALARQSLAQLPHYAVWAISITAITRLLLSLHHVGAPTKRHSHAMPMRRLDSGHGSQHDATPEVIDDAFRKFIERYFDVDDPRNSDDSLPDYDHTYGPRRHFAPTVIHLPNLKFDHA